MVAALARRNPITTIFVAIFIGAALGALLVTRTGLVVPLVLTGAAVLAGTAACALHPAARHPANA